MNFFELLQQPQQFQVDLNSLHDAQISLQAEFHPDKYVNASDQEKRISMQKAVLVNEAYETLKQPVKRANYLLSLAGIDSDDNQTTNDASFLMEQISFREAMGECRTNAAPLDCIENITDKLKNRAVAFSTDFAQQFQSKNYDKAQESARKMMFVKKINDQLLDLQTEIEDEMM